ncbi:MAG: hypothetical protein U0802_22415 [Candidatus Binatia bacterium]
MPADAIPWLAANGVALLALAAALGGWVRARAERRPVALVALAGVALAVATLWLMPPRIDWVTVLMEGRSIRNIRQLYGQGAHFGDGFFAFVGLLSQHDAGTLPRLVRANVSLTVLNTVLFFALASAILRSWIAGFAFAVGYAGNLNTLHAAFSETPAPLWATYFLLGSAATAAAADALGTVRGWVAVAALALLAGLAATLRPELLVIGGLAAALVALRQLGAEDALQGVARALGGALRALLAGRLAVLLLVAAVLIGLQFLPWMGRWSYTLDGLAPLNMSFLLLPQKLGMFLPVGLIALFALGLVYTTRHWIPCGLVSVTLLTLFKIYASATQGAFEWFRYLTFITPVACVVALFGFAELTEWARRWSWPWWWRRAAIPLLVLSMTAWQPLGPRELFGRRQALPGLASVAPLLERNQQTEVRYLLDLVARYPNCVLLAKRPEAETIGGDQSASRWVAFGAPLPRHLEMANAGERLERVAEQMAPSASCVLFYRSLDCSLVDGDECRAEIADREPLEERVLENLEYNDPDSYGAHRAPIHLGVYAVVR